MTDSVESGQPRAHTSPGRPADRRRPGGPGDPVPAFNVPGVLFWVLAFLWGVHAFRSLVLSYPQDVALIVQTAFIPMRYSIDFARQSLAWFWSPLTYSFLHGSYLHLLVNSIWMLAFGAVVARRLGSVRFAALWVASALAGAMLFLAFNWGGSVPVIGASGVVSGLMGAAARFAFPSSGRFRRANAHFLPRVGIVESLTNRTVAAYIGIWFAINLATALGLSTGGEAGQAIAWEAHIGGFLCGFLLFGLFDRRDWA